MKKIKDNFIKQKVVTFVKNLIIILMLLIIGYFISKSF